LTTRTSRRGWIMEQGCRTQQLGANAKHALELAGLSPAAVSDCFFLCMSRIAQLCGAFYNCTQITSRTDWLDITDLCISSAHHKYILIQSLLWNRSVVAVFTAHSHKLLLSLPRQCCGVAELQLCSFTEQAVSTPS